MKKLSIVGAGNAGVISALHFRKYCPDLEIELNFAPQKHPIEQVGVGTTYGVAALISEVLKVNYFKSKIDQTLKAGNIFRHWGKKNEFILADFGGAHNVAFHYDPNKLSYETCESGLFNVVYRPIEEPEKQIDADFIIDCRGKKEVNLENRIPITNPINAALISSHGAHQFDSEFTSSVATPNGWTFIIRLKNKISVGYLYNKDITSREDAEKDFKERFNVHGVELALDIDNYYSKNAFVNERTLLNGNQYGFIEPLEATATGLYKYIASSGYDYLFNSKSKEECNDNIIEQVKAVENFILWHYQYGSVYDTPFWEYAKSLPFNPDSKFYDMIGFSRRPDYQNILNNYGQWSSYSFRQWREGVES